MSLALLLDSLVRESATLFAATATHKGARTPLGGLADRMFFGLSDELQKLDVKRRVCADMFAMAPRAYIRKVRRVEESATDQGRSLWASAYEYIVANSEVTWSAISNRFPRDDEEILRGVLRDLTESGLISTAGRAASAVYSAVMSAELVDQALGRHVTRELLWALIYRDGPITQSDLQRRAMIAPKTFDSAVAQLVASGRVTTEEREGEQWYRSELFSPERDKKEGWEGAIFDHFHAVVKTLSTFLSRPELGASAVSTYTFDLAPDHPMAAEVKELFVDLRSRASALRTKVDAYNSEHPLTDPKRTILYLGLCKDVPEVTRTVDDDDD
jgi:DNA-binding MarR family transcriptional regulator